MNRIKFPLFPLLFFAIFYYYLNLVKEDMSEDPVEALMQYRPIQLSVIIWALTCFLVIYGD
mgnify:CR=1 FL=1